MHTLPMERWKSLKKAPLYEVSDKGRVRSWIGWRDGRRAKKPRVLKPWLNRGYPTVTIAGVGKRLAHRLVLETFVGPCPKGLESRHINGKAHDARLSNLKWGTSKQNKADKKRHGTSNTGERNPMAKLSKVDVRAIRKAAKTRKHGFVSQTARDYGVHYNTISFIVNGQRWNK